MTQHQRRETLLGHMSEVARQVVALVDKAAAHAPVGAISVRERRVLAQFAKGGSSASIARKLKISLS